MRSNLINDLVNANIIKHGDFVLKSGQRSSIYCDLRKLVSHPKLLVSVCLQLSKIIETKHNIVLAGVPMGAIPYSTCLSVMMNVPSLMIRDERKKYGTQNLIEGDYNNEDVILIEDVVTTGKSILDTINILKNENINVKEIIAILDREAGGYDNILKETGIKIKSLFKLSDLRDTNSVISNANVRPAVLKITSLIKDKGTNIILSPDLTDTEKVIGLIDQVGQYILGVKLHTDIYKHHELPQFIKRIKELKSKYNLIIIEDRKFSDIGSIVSKQISIISEWADIVTAHTITGESMIKALNDANMLVLPIYQLSTGDNLIDHKYSLLTKEMAYKYDNIIGFITQEHVTDNLLNFSPGINIDDSGDQYAQRYNTPEIMKAKGIDIFIVGRGIYNSGNNGLSVVEQAIKYRDHCIKKYII